MSKGKKEEREATDNETNRRVRGHAARGNRMEGDLMPPKQLVNPQIETGDVLQEGEAGYDCRQYRQALANGWTPVETPPKGEAQEQKAQGRIELHGHKGRMQLDEETGSRIPAVEDEEALQAKH